MRDEDDPDMEDTGVKNDVLELLRLPEPRNY